MLDHLPTCIEYTFRLFAGKMYQKQLKKKSKFTGFPHDFKLRERNKIKYTDLVQQHSVLILWTILHSHSLRFLGKQTERMCSQCINKKVKNLRFGKTSTKKPKKANYLQEKGLQRKSATQPEGERFCDEECEGADAKRETRENAKGIENQGFLRTLKLQIRTFLSLSPLSPLSASRDLTQQTVLYLQPLPK